MKRLSVDDVMGMERCEEYHEDRVRELFGDRETLSLLEILDLNIPAKDRVCVMLQDGVVEDEALRRFANVVADRAVQNHALTYEPTREWAEKWLSGEDRSEQSAWSAVRSSMETKYCAAVASAARAAYWAAVAARRALMAAGAAEWARMAATSGRAERELQVADMRRLLLEAEV